MQYNIDNDFKFTVQPKINGELLDLSGMVDLKVLITNKKNGDFEPIWKLTENGIEIEVQKEHISLTGTYYVEIQYRRPDGSYSDFFQDKKLANPVLKIIPIGGKESDDDGQTAIIEVSPEYKGADGITPHIDEETGNWFIGDEDTGVSAKPLDSKITLNTAMADGSVQYFNTARIIYDATHIWEDGDILKSVFIPIIGKSNNKNTLLNIYDSDLNLKRSISIGILSNGENTVDLSQYSIILQEGDIVALRYISYSLLNSTERFYDIVLKQYLNQYTYFFSFEFERKNQIANTVNSLLERVNNLKTYPTQGKKLLVFGDSAVDGSNWAQNIIAELKFDRTSIIQATGGYTYATQYKDSIVYEKCLRTLIDRFELNSPTFTPDIIIFQIGGNDYWIYASDNNKLGSIESAFSNNNYLKTDDSTIYGGIRRNLEYLRRKFPNATMIVGTNFQSRGVSRRIISDAIIDVCRALSIPVVDGNKDSGISQYLEGITPIYTDSPTGTPTVDYPNYNWVEPDGSVVSLENKTNNAIKRYGLYTYDGTHQSIIGRIKIKNYWKNILLNLSNE